MECSKDMLTIVRKQTLQAEMNQHLCYNRSKTLVKELYYQ